MGFVTDIFKDETVSAYGKLIYCCLGMYVDKNGYCWPSTKTISANVGISRPTVLKAIQELIKAGYVECQKRNNEENNADISNLYYLPRVKEIDTGVNVIDRGCKGGLHPRVNEVDTNFNNKNFKDITNICPRKISDLHLSLATFFQGLIRERKADYKFTGTVEKWADTIRLMIEKDGRAAERIRAVIKWSQADSFWQNNILSPDKLRKQFDRLEMQMNKELPKRKFLEFDDEEGEF